MNTNFIHDTIEFKGLTFTFDGNSKITASNGTFDEPKPNAFSTVQIQDCPGHTPSCSKECYVHGLEKHAPDLHDCYKANSANMKRVLTIESDAQNLANMYAEWINENCKEFRWHVSGDVFSAEYAMFIRIVCAMSPDVTHWMYTRSFDFVEYIVNVDNLVVNLSADKDNIKEARNCALKYNLRVCYFSEEGEIPSLNTNDVIFPNYSLRGRELENPTEHEWWQGLNADTRKLVCPVDFYGQSEKRRCGKCTKCMVQFPGLI